MVGHRGHDRLRPHREHRNGSHRRGGRHHQWCWGSDGHDWPYREEEEWACRHGCGVGREEEEWACRREPTSADRLRRGEVGLSREGREVLLPSPSDRQRPRRWPPGPVRPELPSGNRREPQVLMGPPEEWEPRPTEQLGLRPPGRVRLGPQRPESAPPGPEPPGPELPALGRGRAGWPQHLVAQSQVWSGPEWSVAVTRDASAPAPSA